MNFSQAIESRGIIESKALASLKRSRAMLSRQDGFKVFPGGIGRWGQDFIILNTTTCPERYIRAWCRLNNLKH